MKILIIGGSYFVGRVLTLMASKNHELTLVNRGHYSMEDYGVKEYHFDRHDQMAWRNMSYENYDAVVDLCAYQKGDIQIVANCLNGNIKHYVFISTVDVYQRQTGVYKDENHPLEFRHFNGEVGDYICGKVALEKELQEIGIPYTSLRPGNIYGPFNYAPRESEFIKRVTHKEPLYNINEAQAKFQLVYVKDVVNAILKVIENKAYHKIYNVISPQCISYLDIYQCFSDAIIQEKSLQELMNENYPLPYPIGKEEEELYDGKLIEQELGLKYTSLLEGMRKTYEALLPLSGL